MLLKKMTVIEFYIPARYKSKQKWISPENKGKILEFPKPEPAGDFLARLKTLCAPNPEKE